MFTNSSGLKRHNELAQVIMKEFHEISHEFSSFQKKSKLNCIEGCGKCCFKPDIYCSPVELLPMALELLSKGEAQNFYDKCQSKKSDRCIFLDVTDEENFKATCTHYEHRPLVCRTFGVSVRHDKNDKIELSVCRPIKEERTAEYEKVLNTELTPGNRELPFIDVCKNRLMSLDPLFLEQERPINEALKIILEKVLFYSAFDQE